jgi:regulator of sigma E protease
LITILATIFVLGVLIFFHELGHFIVAKRVGIRVDKFSLGFPPTLISKKWGETVYAIGVIPLGGYVKMAGENPDEDARGESWEFMSKAVWQRFLVILAGPFMNFLLAALVLGGLYFVRGKEVGQDIDTTYVGSVAPDKPAEKAGIRPGDRIVSVDGIKVETFDDMAALINARVEESLIVAWQRDGQRFVDTLLTYKSSSITETGDTVDIGLIGISPRIIYEHPGFFGSLKAGFDESVFYVRMVFKFVYGLLTRQIGPSELGGPVIIGKLAGETARAGFDVLLQFLALLSVNLAVLNVLPIPILDGGHLIFLMIEKIKGSPLSMKSRLVAQQVGLAFIIIVMIFVTFNDISRLQWLYKR